MVAMKGRKPSSCWICPRPVPLLRASAKHWKAGSSYMSGRYILEDRRTNAKSQHQGGGRMAHLGHQMFYQKLAVSYP